MSRPVHARVYAPSGPRHGGGGGTGHVIIHPNPAEGVTPVSQPAHATWAADSAPYHNTGYVYPQQGPLITGGFLSLRLPPRAAMIDLTDTTTWDRPVWMAGAR